MTETLTALRSQRERTIRTRCGIAASVAFSVLVVGSNIPAPLLPLYRDDLQLSTFVVTALFAAYLVALVATFSTVAATSVTRRARVVLPLALVIGATADVSFWIGQDDVRWLFVGRLLTGVAVGLGTGTTATIAVAMRGERGRAIAATGTLAGSFLGLAGAAVIAQFLPGPTTTVYWMHIALLSGAGVVLVLTLRSARTILATELRRSPVPEVADAPNVDEPPVIAPAGRRLRWAGYGLGIAGWAIGGIVVGLLPTVITDQMSSPSIVVTTLGPIVLLGAACLSPYLFRSMRPEVAVAIIGLAAVMCLIGVWLANLPTILACCMIWGIGQGFAYAYGLRIVTAGLLPTDQGRVASRYASICYGFTGVLSVATGAAATAWGTMGGMFLMAGVFVALCGGVAVLGYRRWP
ncbi:MFS transporter [Gordonia sp. HNM0687]|uniref:MFS transporter n=1 Tax=Gordonia mangrovi TaxID=2665643 RepID=A0A6L7GYA0_9ACTN|nr:MFS transporter [Gordonia mangrovi]MXP24231.1 MFS transporter [Gordonia mangrovi]UVF79948.1 MFS transporter [Gordonia mangrovi]